ncbi:MAG TPA: ABC transporter ATP-binding protein, partial [Pseudorhizobium sp.]|nr:ABC transporter ATP-binding protein [Pseudorhizobium sp.]
TGLHTWTVSGPDVHALQAELEHADGIDMLAPFGTSLHVAGRDEQALEAAIAPYRERPGLAWQRGEPTLEDAFIDLMRQSEDNFR